MESTELYKPQYIAERIKNEAKQKDVTLKVMLAELGLGVNVISHLRHGKMIAADSLARIADYLGCSVDYLLGNTDDPTAPGKIKKLPASGGELAEEALDRELIARLCSLSAEELARVDAFVQGLLASR